MSSLLYHLQPPTIVKSRGESIDLNPEIAFEKDMQMRSLEGFKVKPEDDFIKSRVPVLVNSDCHIVLAAPKKSLTSYFLQECRC